MLHEIDVPDDEPAGGERSEWHIIFDSWARSWRKSAWSGTVRNCDWDAVSRSASQEIVDRPTTAVRVVFSLDTEGRRRIKGYIVAEPSKKVIHWVYTKRDFRGQGVARALIEYMVRDTNPRDWVYTHRTVACQRLFRGMKHDKSYACQKG